MIDNFIERYAGVVSENEDARRREVACWRELGKGLELGQPTHIPSVDLGPKRFRYYVMDGETIDDISGPQPHARLRGMMRDVLHGEARVVGAGGEPVWYKKIRY